MFSDPMGFYIIHRSNSSKIQLLEKLGRVSFVTFTDCTIHARMFKSYSEAEEMRRSIMAAYDNLRDNLEVWARY